MAKKRVLRDVNRAAPTNSIAGRFSKGNGPVEWMPAREVANKLLGQGGVQRAIDDRVSKKGVKRFIQLLDVPSDYTGSGEFFVKVKATEDGLEFVDAAGAVIAFVDLTDVPSTYVGAANYLVAVNATEDGLEFVPIPVVAFTDLTDVPASYSGAGGEFVVVRGDELGLEFSTTPPHIPIYMPVTLGDDPPTFVIDPNNDLIYTLRES